MNKETVQALIVDLGSYVSEAHGDHQDSDTISCVFCRIVGLVDILDGTVRDIPAEDWPES